MEIGSKSIESRHDESLGVFSHISRGFIPLTQNRSAQCPRLRTREPILQLAVPDRDYNYRRASLFFAELGAGCKVGDATILPVSGVG